MTEPHYYSRLGCVASTQGGNLPHWSQRCATFVTFRLGDSLPEGKLAQLQAEREEWLKEHPRFLTRQDAASTLAVHGASLRPFTRQDAASTIAVHGASLRPFTRQDAASTIAVHGASFRRRDVLVASDKDGLNPSNAAGRRVYVDAASCRVNADLSVYDEEADYRELFSERIQRWLDAGHGSCLLRQVETRQIVEDALRHFADSRYSLYAFVVMPNHVHVLFMPEEGYDGRGIVQGWKSYTAKAINGVLGRTGAVWQKESYDHLVRNVEEFNAIRDYIRGNNAKLAYDAYSL